MKHLTTILIVALTALSFQLQAVNEPSLNYTGVWTGFSLKKNLPGPWQFSLEHQIRYSTEFNNFSTNLIEIGGKYKFNKQFNAKLKYRYTARYLARNTNRFSFDLNYKTKMHCSNFNVRARLRFQNSTVTYTHQHITAVRARIGLDYKFSKKIRPYADYEVFYRLNKKNEIRANRYSFGVKYALSKKLIIDGFYQIDQEKNVKEREKQNVFGLMLTYKI